MGAEKRQLISVVTGANAGLGFEIAKALFEDGGHVIVAGRNPTRVQSAIQTLRSGAGSASGTLEAGMVDLGSLASVRAFAQELRRRHERLDLLINNAGVMVPPPGTTEDGFELQFGINFVGHFALSGLVFPLLEASGVARVVTMSSIAHRGATIDFGNLRLERPYAQWREYGQSKLADLVFALELQRRLEARGSRVSSLGAHPGVSRTELTRNLSHMPADVSFMSAEQGAAPALVAARSPEARGGQYWGPNGADERSGEPGLARIDPVAQDPELGAKLWGWAEQATEVSFPG